MSKFYYKANYWKANYWASGLFYGTGPTVAIPGIVRRAAGSEDAILRRSSTESSIVRRAGTETASVVRRT